MLKKTHWQTPNNHNLCACAEVNKASQCEVNYLLGWMQEGQQGYTDIHAFLMLVLQK